MKLNRKYFQEKKTGKRSGGSYTKCCDQLKDRHILNKKKPHEWKLIEDHCENHLISYSSCETIEPICCKVCGRLLKYLCTLNSKSYHEKYWTDYANQNNISLFNIYDDFRQRLIGKDKKLFIKENYIVNDVHFNFSGNVKVADYIINKLDY